MLQCIYCFKKEPDVAFKGEEHVIPKLLGVFHNNLKLPELVCDNCNSVVFNLLETKFKEDTEEGIYCQMYNFENNIQIRIRNENAKSSFTYNLTEKFFSETFPFFRFIDGGWKVVFLPQIKAKGYGKNGYVILLVDEIKKRKISSKKIKSVKKILKKVRLKDMQIFVHGNGVGDSQDMDDTIELLNKLGVKYSEKERKFAPSITPDTDYMNMAIDGSIGNDVGRVVAKIAFNYLAYCALKSGNTQILFHDNFLKIRSYISGTVDTPIKEIVSDIKHDTVIIDEKLKGIRFIAHMVSFRLNGNDIISEISFFGRKIYTVQIGKCPNELKNDNFGCAHLFHPSNHAISQLTQNPKKWGTDSGLGFGLFSRM